MRMEMLVKMICREEVKIHKNRNKRLINWKLKRNYKKFNNLKKRGKIYIQINNKQRQNYQRKRNYCKFNKKKKQNWNI